MDKGGICITGPTDVHDMKTVSGAFVIVATLAISALVLTGGAYSLTSSVDISGNQMLSDSYALDIYSDTEARPSPTGRPFSPMRTSITGPWGIP